MVAVCVEEIRAVLLWHAVSEPYAWPESGTRVVDVKMLRKTPVALLGPALP